MQIYQHLISCPHRSGWNLHPLAFQVLFVRTDHIYLHCPSSRFHSPLNSCFWGYSVSRFFFFLPRVKARGLINSRASLGGSVGSVRCAVRLETRRSRVRPPPRSATFFRGDWSWNIFYGHSLPSAEEEGQLSVSEERMCTILVNRLED